MDPLYHPGFQRAKLSWSPRLLTQYSQRILGQLRKKSLPPKMSPYIYNYYDHLHFFTKSHLVAISCMQLAGYGWGRLSGYLLPLQNVLYLIITHMNVIKSEYHCCPFQRWQQNHTWIKQTVGNNLKIYYIANVAVCNKLVTYPSKINGPACEYAKRTIASRRTIPTMMPGASTTALSGCTKQRGVPKQSNSTIHVDLDLHVLSMTHYNWKTKTQT